MTACIISPNVSKESAQQLAEVLGLNYYADRFNDLRMFDTVINYGSTHNFLYNKVINTPEAVQICKNKISTLKRLKDKCNTVIYTKEREVANSWREKDLCVVAREFETQSQNKGITFCLTKEKLDTAPAKFWTKYQYHTNELRINVFKDKIISVFDKQKQEDGTWKFAHLTVTGMHPDVKAMIQAIQENIKIDLYGMDVLVNKFGKHVLLEINSGAILHPETEKPLSKLLKKEI